MLLDLVVLRAAAISSGEGPAIFSGGEAIAGCEMDDDPVAICSLPGLETLGVDAGDVG